MTAKHQKHCRRYGWLDGYCGRLACSRCGSKAYADLQARIVACAKRWEGLYFMTLYFDPRWEQDLTHLPLFVGQKSIAEKKLRAILSRIFRALRDLARRNGMQFEYCIVLALSKVYHNLHKVMHSHALVTWLPDAHQHPTSRRPDRLECPWIEKKLAKDHMIVWIEKPRSKTRVARYVAQNAKTTLGKPEYAGIRIYRMSQGFEK